jgi:hypothetical protein
LRLLHHSETGRAGVSTITSIWFVQLESLISGGTVKKKLLLLTIAVLCLASYASADNVIYFGQRVQQQADDLFDWGQIPELSFVPTPSIVGSFNGNLMLFGNTGGGGGDMVRVNEGSSWLGAFDYGQSLIWTGNPNFLSGTGLGPMAFFFNNPVASVGLSIQSDFYGDFQYQMVVLDTSGNPLFITPVLNGSSNPFENGSAPYIGVGDLSGANIGGFEVTTSDPNAPGDFAVDSVTTGSVFTPEPSSLVLLGSGLLGVVGVIRRKLAR